MANEKASLNLTHFWINVKDEDDIYNGLLLLLEVDADLTENEEQFRADTLNLGYENEADRIVKEALKGKTITNIAGFKQIAKKVASHISDQEFFGACELSFTSINPQLTVVAFATGGSKGI